MKKVLYSLLTLVLVIPTIVIPEKVEGKTVGDLKKEIAELEAQIKNNKNEKKYTQEQIDKAQSEINSISNTINRMQYEIKDLNDEIDKLNIDIVNKDQEIKKIMNFVQTANGESAYLEYAFGAQDFTDFIYRIAISEQLANYNKELITQFNNMIKENNQKKEELNRKTIELSQKQLELRDLIKKLNSNLASLNQVGATIEEDLRVQKEFLKYYQDLGCKDNEDINTCGRESLPPDTALLRPVTSARITSDYGERQYYDAYGRLVSDYHRGIDMSETGSAVPIYASGNGKVVLVTRFNCGGNVVFIQHNINGKVYVTLYGHLRTILVSKNQIVDRYTQIGTMGGNPKTETWEDPKCTSGQHLHFQISNKNYVSWNDFDAHSINPRLMVNFPAEGARFKDRLTKY